MTKSQSASRLWLFSRSDSSTTWVLACYARLMPDVNMEVARRLGVGIGGMSADELPASLADPETRAKLVDAIDGPLLPDGAVDFASFEHLGRRLSEIAERSRPYVHDLPNDVERLGVCLRLWSGCISAAKTIAFETRSGPNDARIRGGLFLKAIDPIAATDRVYEAGVEAAPAFKRFRRQGYSLDGVPPGSAVRRREPEPASQYGACDPRCGDRRARVQISRGSPGT